MVEFINVNCTIQMANIEDRLNFRDHRRHLGLSNSERSPLVFYGGQVNLMVLIYSTERG